MQKLISCDEKEMLSKVNYIKNFHFNRLPKPFTIVSKEEFENYEDTWYPDFVGIGQIHNDDEKALLLGDEIAKNSSMISIRYRFYDTHGYAKCKFTKKVQPKNSWERPTYEDDIVYIKFGCSHKNRELVEKDAFERVYKCNDCGQVWSEQTGY